MERSWLMFKSLKGTVHPKNEHNLLSLKYFQTCMNVFVLLNTKEDILKKVCNQGCFGTPLTSIVGQNILFPRTALCPTFLRISSFVFGRTNTFIQVWKYLRLSKWWQNCFIFGCTVPLIEQNVSLNLITDSKQPTFESLNRTKRSKCKSLNCLWMLRCVFESLLNWCVC